MKYAVALVLLLCLVCCHQKADKEDTTGKPQPQLDTVVHPVPATHFNPDSKLYIWKATDNYKKIKNPVYMEEILNADSLIKGLNELNENVFVEKITISGDTLYTIIRNSTYLAEQMGSTGAEVYVADLVLNLTAVPGIKYVHLQLEEGSHIQPGTWSQDNFKKYKETN